VKIKEMDALNTSDHTLILSTVGVDVKRAAPKAAKILFFYHPYVAMHSCPHKL
jgi:hypothetical protein